MLITREEIKEILELTESDHDKFIDRVLPSAIGLLFSETQNTFEKFTDEIYLEADTISFSNTDETILDSGNGFIEAGFVAGLLLRISNSFFNDGYFRSIDCAAGKITCESGSLKDEVEGRTILITVAEIPEEAKLFVAKLIEYYLPNKANKQNIESEKFEDYSVKYNLKSEDIPDSIRAIINPFQKLNWE